jgi:hypothetical protein
MPEVSRSWESSFALNYDEHPPPHFHAHYAEYQAQIAIETHAILRGRLPGRVLGLVQEWAELHREQLQHCWEQVMRNEVPAKIEPLV